MKTLILDLDGTMYRGTQIIESAKQFIDYCLKHSIPFLFLTNNSMRTQAENAKHMLDMGYIGIKPEMFYNSAMASVEFVKRNYKGNKAYYIGQEGMKEALMDGGFILSEDHPDFVFVGLQKDIDYHGYSKALSFLLNGAILIGTNKDHILAKPDGFELGNGAIVSMFEFASKQVSPDIAKPNLPILEYCLSHYGLKKEDIILIGDNLTTDIKLGYDHGIKTVFVQTGVHSKDDIERLKIYPDIIVDSLMDLVGMDL